MRSGEVQSLQMAVAVALLSVIVWPVGLFDHPAWSQSSRTIKIVVPFPAGGSADILARLVGDQISKAHGATIVIENRPGAGASIGYEAVARAAADGNTLGIVANSVVINPIMRKASYDPQTSFEPICYLFSSPQVIVVNSASSYRTLDDLLADARAHPGERTLAALGPATTQHIGFEQFKRLANVDLTFVPFQGGGPAINALLGGHVTAVFQNFSEAVEQLNAGKLRALATSSRTRIAPLPDVPTVAELGYKDFAVEAWFGIVAPAKTPKAQVSELVAWFNEASHAPEVQPKLAAIGLYPTAICGGEFAAHIRAQHEEYSRIIAAAGIKSE
jgi:tripartite-type tricarboxylate transporter receptor subunit TctC